MKQDMNPFLDNKTVRLQRSISVKLNPQDKSCRFIKQSCGFNRQFSFKAKNIHLPQKQLNSNLSNLHYNIQTLQTSQTPPTKLFKNFSDNEKSNNLNISPFNPFDYLTDSSIKKPFKQQQLNELKLKQSHEKIQQLSQQVSNLTMEISQLKSQIFKLKRENTQLINQSKLLSQQNTHLRSTISQLHKHHIHVLEKTSNEPIQSSFRQLGKQFENKINTLYDQNYKLKNNCSLLSSKLQQSQTLLRSSLSMNDMLQKRFTTYQQQNNIMKERLRIENEQLKKQCEILKQEKEMIRSENEMEMLKLENQIYQLKNKRQQIDKINNGNQGYSGDTDKLYSQQYDMINTKNKRVINLHNINVLNLALKEQIDQTTRLRDKNKKLTKILSQLTS